MTGTWQPSAAWMRALRKALDAAFDEYSLELLTSDYFHPDTFSKIASPGLGKTFEVRLHELIQSARMHDWLPDLVAAAHERRPGSRALADLASGLGLTLTGPRLDSPHGAPLEELVRENARFLTPEVLYTRLPVLEGQVCWVDVPGGGGTGFLVGPDLVLTNQHVVAPLVAARARPQDVRCVFDHRRPVDGTDLTRKQPTRVELASGWLVDSRPPSRFDWEPTLGEAGADEIDSALLRLAEPVGELPVGGDTVDDAAPLRGWLTAGTAPPPLAAGNQVLLLQHPRGDPLRLSVGEVSAFNTTGTRVRYDANSRDGSSGSPVLDADLQLVALHHAHDPAYPPAWNQGVPLTTIQKVWPDLLPGPPAGG